jgi:mannose-6-phosphate isomerase-like protein (cupin superfamily)
MPDIVVTRLDEAPSWREGQELCRSYRKDSEMAFGTSYLEPGHSGAVDSGHQRGKEVFFCAYGRVIVEFSAGNTVRLAEGDAVIIPPTEPHTLINDSDEPVLIVWSLAPPDE